MNPANYTLPDLPSDLTAERAVLCLALFHGRAATVLERLDRLDFTELGHRFLFDELRLMDEAGETVGDHVATPRWFTGAPCQRRSTAAELVGPPAVRIIELMREQESYLPANEGHYVGILKRERSWRILWAIPDAMRKRWRDSRESPKAAIAFLQEQTDRAWELMAESCPDDSGVEADA